MKRSQQYFDGYRCAWKDACTALINMAANSPNRHTRHILDKAAHELGEAKHKQKREPMQEELETYTAL